MGSERWNSSYGVSCATTVNQLNKGLLGKRKRKTKNGRTSHHQYTWSIVKRQWQGKKECRDTRDQTTAADLKQHIIQGRRRQLLQRTRLIWECTEEVTGWLAFKESRSGCQLFTVLKTFLTERTILFGKVNVILVYFRSQTSEREICKYWILVAVLCRTR